MSIKLLALVLTLLGVFPQSVCQCAPRVAACRGAATEEPAAAADRSCCRHHHADATPDRLTASFANGGPSHHHEHHQNHCPSLQPKPTWETTAPVEFVVPAAEAVSAPVEVQPEPLDRPQIATAIDRSPPHVPLFLSLCVLRN